MIAAAITALIVTMACWAGIVLGITLTLIHHVKKLHGRRCRHSDRMIALLTLIVIVGPITVMFTYPTWLYGIPLGTFILSLGLGSILFYLTDLQQKNLKRLRKHHPLTKQ